MHTFTQLILDDMKPALGVTEPAAIALACAKARSLTKEDVQSVLVRDNFQYVPSGNEDFRTSGEMFAFVDYCQYRRTCLRGSSDD